MSKSDSSTRGDSMEIPTECEVDLGSPHGNFSQLADSLSGVPSSPPPSYEHVLEEVCLNSYIFRVHLSSVKKQHLKWYVYDLRVAQRLYPNNIYLK